MKILRKKSIENQIRKLQQFQITYNQDGIDLTITSIPLDEIQKELKYLFTPESGVLSVRIDVIF